MIVYKFDVMAKLKEKGYNTGRIRRERLISEQALQDIRMGVAVKSTASLNKLCGMLDMQPGSIFKYVPDNEE